MMYQPTRKKSSGTPVDGKKQTPGPDPHQRGDKAHLGPMAEANLKTGVVIPLTAPVQAKVALGKSGDRYEREADAVSDSVNAGRPAPEISRIPPGGLRAQRQDDDRDVDDSGAGEPVQERSETETEKEVSSPAAGEDRDESIPAPVQAENEVEENAQTACDDCGPREPVQAAESEDASDSPSEPVQASSAASSETDPEELPVQAWEDENAAQFAETENDAVQAQDDDVESGVSDGPSEGADQTEAEDSEEGSERQSAGPDAANEAVGCGTESAGGGQEAESGGGNQAGCGGGQETAEESPAGGEGEEAAESDAEAAGKETTEDTPSQDGGGGESACDAEAQRSPEEGSDEPAVQEQGESDDAEPAPDGAAVQEQGESEQTNNGQDEEDNIQAQDEGGDDVQEAAHRRGSAATATVSPPGASNRRPTAMGKAEIAGQAIRNRCPGEPLAPGVREHLEKAMDYDFGHVRLHTTTRAREVSKKMKAKAFTHKNHIWLGPGQSPADLKLLAHEMTHVVQQGAVQERTRSAEPDQAPGLSKPEKRLASDPKAADTSRPDSEAEKPRKPESGISAKRAVGDRKAKPAMEEKADTAPSHGPATARASSAKRVETGTSGVALRDRKAVPTGSRSKPTTSGIIRKPEAPPAEKSSTTVTPSAPDALSKTGPPTPLPQKTIPDRAPLETAAPSAEKADKTRATPKKQAKASVAFAGGARTPQAPSGATPAAQGKTSAGPVSLGAAGTPSELLGRFAQISPIRAPIVMKSLTKAVKQASKQRRVAEENHPPTAEYHPAAPELAKRKATGEVQEKHPAQWPSATTDRQIPAASAPIKPHEHREAAAVAPGMEKHVQRIDQMQDGDNTKGQDFFRQWMLQIFKFIPEYDAGVDTNPGPAPRIVLSGASDPRTIEQIKADGGSLLSTEAALRERERLQDYGEDNIAPEQVDEKITRRIPSRRPPKQENCPGAEKIEPYRFDPEDEADLSERIRPRQEKEYQDQIEKLAEAENERDSEIENARADGSRRIRDLHTNAYLKQVRAVAQGKTTVVNLREGWKKENDDLLIAYDNEAGGEGRRVDREIKGHSEKDRTIIAKKYEDEGDRAVKAHAQVQAKSKEIKAQGEKESSSWLVRAGRWIKDKVKKLASWVWEKISNLFKALRAKIKEWFEALKKWAIEKIEQLRKWAIEKLENFRKWAHDMVDRYLGRYPEVAKFFKRGIDFTVDTAQQAVNRTAAALKKGVALIIDGMAALIDGALALVEKVVELGLWFVCNLVVTGINLVVVLVQQDLEAVIELVRDLPEPSLLGPLWPALKYALLGYLETLKSKPEEEKKRYARKTKWLVISPAYYGGVLLGVLKGVIWDGLVGLLRMLYDIVVELPKAIVAIYEYFKSRLADVEAIEAMIADAMGVWREIQAFLKKPDGPEQIIAFLRRTPSILHGMVREAYRQVKGWAYGAGAEIANTLFAFVLKSSHFEMGMAVGTILGRVLFEVALLLLTSGAGTLVKWGGKVLQVLGKAGRFLTRAAKGASIIMRALRSLRAIVMRGLNVAKRIGKGMGRILMRVKRLVNNIFAWFKRGIQRIRPRGKVGRRRLPGTKKRPVKPPKKKARPTTSGIDRNAALWRGFVLAVRSKTLPYRKEGVARRRLKREVKPIAKKYTRVIRFWFIRRREAYWRIMASRKPAKGRFRILKAMAALKPVKVAKVLMDRKSRWKAGQKAVRKAAKGLKRKGPFGTEELKAKIAPLKSRYRYHRLEVDFEKKNNVFSVEGAMSALKPITKIAPPTPGTKVTYSYSSGLPTMHADPLSAKGRPGSPTTTAVRPRNFNAAGLIRSRGGKVSLYVKGHLLWAGAHGSGTNPDNLTWITRSLNGRMYRAFERELKRGLLVRPKRRRKVFNYKVAAVGGAKPRSPRRYINGRFIRIPDERRLAKTLHITLKEKDYIPAARKWQDGKEVKPAASLNNVPPYPRGYKE